MTTSTSGNRSTRSILSATTWSPKFAAYVAAACSSISTANTGTKRSVSTKPRVIPPQPANRSMSRWRRDSAMVRSYVRVLTDTICRRHGVQEISGGGRREGPGGIEGTVAHVGCVVGVDHGRALVGVAHPLLDGPERRTGGGHPRSEGVPQVVEPRRPQTGTCTRFHEPFPKPRGVVDGADLGVAEHEVVGCT